MTKNVTSEQTERLLKLPEMIRGARNSCRDAEVIRLPTLREMYDERMESVREAEALLSERKRSAAAAADEFSVAEAKFEADKKNLEALTAELEELLRPYDEEIAEHEAKSKEMEEDQFRRLIEAMASSSWTEEECRRAAKRYVEDKVDWLGLQTKKDIIAKMRRGEDFPGGVHSFWG